jgi:metallo-beta-lactamase family protein
MKITFWGASREVTGSKHLLEIGGRRLLLDAGFFQGKRQQAEKKNRNLPFRGEDIDAVILSHGHLDHCGALPTLYKSGFRGDIFATPATRDVAQIIMADSADIQVNDASYINSYKPREQWIEPIYTPEEAKKVMDLFKTVPYGDVFEPVAGVRAKFIEAGHILGSAQVYLECEERDKRLRIGFTGDLGRRGLPILRDPDFFPELDILISESTYGNRKQDSVKQAEEKVKRIVLEAVKKRGKIIVPAFALGRTQSLIYILHKLTDKKEIPRIPIFIDSPMATEITEVFLKHKNNFDKELLRFFANERDPFSFRNLHFTQSVQESKSLNNRRGPFMVISTAGMCEVGRIRHHLKNSIENRNNTILITGFMAKDTLGRRIVEKEPEVKIFDRMYKLKAKVEVINTLSAHAGQAELFEHIKKIKKLRRIFLVHGEPEAQNVFAQKIHGYKPLIKIDRPRFGESFDL